MTVRIHTTPGFDYLADVAIAYARTADHGQHAGLDEDQVRAAIGGRLAIDAQAGRVTDWALLCDYLTALADERTRKGRVMTNQDDEHPDHECPGGCGRSVPHHWLACTRCWWLLPLDQRTAISKARGQNRLQLVSTAIGWYRENVRDGELTPAATTKPAPRITIADGGFPRG